MRTEKDITGEVNLEDDCLFGINTVRANENFNISGKRVHKELLREIIMLKKAAARANAHAGVLDASKADYIAQACDRLLSEDINYEIFPTDCLQGGAGTSTNMNVNEVVCNLALTLMGEKPGNYSVLDPFDHVNLNQSTNDIYPTALRIAAIKLIRQLSDECARLQESLQKKEQEYEGIKKPGRTELMDAMEVSLGDEFAAYSQSIARDRWRLYKSEERLRFTNIGSGSIGKIGNKKFAFKITELIREYSGIGLARAEYPMDITQNCDVFSEVHGLVKALAVSLIKISNDLRLMNSNFLGEIHLKPMQVGSSAMPGKINPVIPEMTIQAAVKVMANDYAISYCASAGNLELNAFMPLIAESLLDSLKLMINTVKAFREKCIDTLTADKERCKMFLENSNCEALKQVHEMGYRAVEKMLSEDK